jgi:hypothetical protein
MEAQSESTEFRSKGWQTYEKVNHSVQSASEIDSPQKRKCINENILQENLFTLDQSRKCKMPGRLARLDDNHSETG